MGRKRLEVELRPVRQVLRRRVQSYPILTLPAALVLHIGLILQNILQRRKPTVVTSSVTLSDEEKLWWKCASW